MEILPYEKISFKELIYSNFSKTPIEDKFEIIISLFKIIQKEYNIETSENFKRLDDDLEELRIKVLLIKKRRDEIERREMLYKGLVYKNLGNFTMQLNVLIQ